MRPSAPCRRGSTWQHAGAGCARGGDGSNLYGYGTSRPRSRSAIALDQAAPSRIPVPGPPLTSSDPCLKMAYVATTERVNLNLPAPARERLRSLARAANKPEAVFARSLLVKAI